MTEVRISYMDKDGYRRQVVLTVSADVDTETLRGLVTEIDPSATFEYAVKA